jgi:hypothetical protein
LFLFFALAFIFNFLSNFLLRVAATEDAINKFGDLAVHALRGKLGASHQMNLGLIQILILNFRH